MQTMEGNQPPRKGSAGPLEASLTLASTGGGLLVMPGPGRSELRVGNSLDTERGRCQPFAVAQGGREEESRGQVWLECEKALV